MNGPTVYVLSDYTTAGVNLCCWHWYASCHVRNFIQDENYDYNNEFFFRKSKYVRKVEIDSCSCFSRKKSKNYLIKSETKLDYSYLTQRKNCANPLTKTLSYQDYIEDYSVDEERIITDFFCFSLQKSSGLTRSCTQCFFSTLRSYLTFRLV